MSLVSAAISFGRRSFRLSKRRKKCVLEKLDSFVNSQEWTLSRNVPDLRLGIVGNLNSGKSALVHRYLTGSYMQDESPEGGRFKKEVFVHGHSNMLLIRDEGGAPEMQFSCWVDAVIFVFNVDNYESFEAIKEYYQKLASFRNNLDQVPLILVGTQDTESSSSGHRVIDECNGRRLAEEMHRDCVYYETCATYGHNVEKVFQDACQKIIQARSAFGLTNCPSPANHTSSYLNTNQLYHPYSSSRPTTPNNQTVPNNNNYLNNNYNNGQLNRQSSPLTTFSSYSSPLNQQQPSSQQNALNSSLRKSLNNTPLNNKNFGNLANMNSNLSVSKAKEQHIFISPNNPMPPKRIESKNSVPLDGTSTLVNANNIQTTVFTPISTIKEALQQNCPKNSNQLPISTTIGSGQQVIKHHNTPVSGHSNLSKSLSNNPETPTQTPNQNRKVRRRSNILFSVSSSKNKNLEEKSRNGELGSGRAIPLRQGYLHKKSVNTGTKLSLKNKEWKKKYVTLTTDGCLTYHASLHDYMNDTHGKKINLMHTTVKIPGQKPRGSSIITSNAMEGDFNRLNLLNVNQNNNSNQINCTVNEMCVDGGNLNDRCANCGSIFQTLDDRRLMPSTNASLKDSSSKKKHRRHKSQQLTNTTVTTNAYCERCATIIENGNGFASTFVANNSNTKSSDSANGQEDDDFVFVIVSLNNKQWHFQAQSAEDREGWLQAIENQILLSLQNIQSDKEKSRCNNSEQANKEKMFKDQIRQIAGNNFCLDCDATNPTWASLNLGGLICIECSGIHRNLGTHISKVRSIDLDDWPQGNISVMLALGNLAVNKIWEYNTKNLNKPIPTSNRDEKELWIRRKYERKEFLCPLSNLATTSDQLESSIRNGEIRKVFQILSQLNNNPTLLNELKFNGNQRCTALQLAASTNNIAITQLIIWSNGNINGLDAQGQNALAYAKSTEMKDFLKSQGCTETKNSTPSLTAQLARSPNSSIINKNYQNTNFMFRDNKGRDNQMSGLVNSDVFDQLPTSII